MELNHPDLALEAFRDSIDDPQTEEREKALSHLLIGQIADLQGRPEEAIFHYRQVLRYRDFEGSHSRAREFIKASESSSR